MDQKYSVGQIFSKRGDRWGKWMEVLAISAQTDSSDQWIYFIKKVDTNAPKGKMTVYEAWNTNMIDRFLLELD